MCLTDEDEGMEGWAQRVPRPTTTNTTSTGMRCTRTRGSCAIPA